VKDTSERNLEVANSVAESVRTYLDPGQGALVFVFDVGGEPGTGSIGYVSTADRFDCLTMMVTWLDLQDPAMVEAAVERARTARATGGEKLC
jgi:hypothetical protein